jgi:hypothetical protein
MEENRNEMIAKNISLPRCGDEGHTKFGRELDEHDKDSKIKNLRVGFSCRLFLRVAKNEHRYLEGSIFFLNNCDGPDFDKSLSVFLF